MYCVALFSSVTLYIFMMLFFLYIQNVLVKLYVVLSK
jgi:hypothetical protein